MNFFNRYKKRLVKKYIKANGQNIDKNNFIIKNLEKKNKKILFTRQIKFKDNFVRCIKNSEFEELSLEDKCQVADIMEKIFMEFLQDFDLYKFNTFKHVLDKENVAIEKL